MFSTKKCNWIHVCAFSRLPLLRLIKSPWRSPSWLRTTSCSRMATHPTTGQDKSCHQPQCCCLIRSLACGWNSSGLPHCGQFGHFVAKFPTFFTSDKSSDFSWVYWRLWFPTYKSVYRSSFFLTQSRPCREPASHRASWFQPQTVCSKRLQLIRKLRGDDDYSTFR